MTPPVYSESLLISSYVKIFVEFFSRDYCDHIAVYEHDTDTIPSQVVPFTPHRRTVPKRLRLDYQDWRKENNSYHG